MAAALACLTGQVGAAAAVRGVDAPASVEQYATPADGVFRMVGAGWGHGRGMSQWGAHQAASEGRTHAEILAFYYPGTMLAPSAPTAVRVLLASDTGRDLVVAASQGLTATHGPAAAAVSTVLAPRPAGCATDATLWRARAHTRGMSLDAYCRGWRTVVPTSALPVGSTIALEVPGGLVATRNGVVRKGYRGQVVASRIGSRALRVVNVVPMEQYLRAVVPAEVSPSWPVEALRAQAIAARTYAAHEMLGRAAGAFDVYDTTRSQVYPGAVAYGSAWQVVRSREDPRTDAAIADTAGLVVTAGTKPALTQFSSSNGGATAGTFLPYMVGAVDEWDARAQRNPRLTWTDSVSAASLARRYPRAGRIVGVHVVAREGVGQWGGRIARLRIVGSARSYTLTTDSAIRAALGVNSSYLTFTSPHA